MKLAYLLLSCSDVPRVTTLTQHWIFRIASNLAGYYLDQSGGREVMEFRVFDWFQLPISSEQWNGWGFDAGDHVIPMVTDSLHVDLSPFDHFVFVIDKEDAKLGATSSDGKYSYMSAQDLDPAILAHELGHQYNANHANLDTPGGPQEYGDNFCIMGAEGAKYSYDNTLLSFTNEAGQAYWRYCMNCQMMFFDGYPTKGTCPAGGAHRAAGYNFVLPHDVPESGQSDWRFCSKCQAMFFDGYPSKGTCPAGGPHVAAGYNFVLPHDVSGPGQSDWRYCQKCESLFFDGYQTKGKCPATGGHEAQGFNFSLPHDIPSHSRSGPSMAAPALLACGWLDLGQLGTGRDLGATLRTRPAETVIELKPLRGAPPPWYRSTPICAWGDGLLPDQGDQRLLIEYRGRGDYDQGLPQTDTGVSGFIVIHLTSGAGRRTTSLQIGVLPVESGSTTYLPGSALNVSVVYYDIGRDTVIVRVSSEAWPPASGQANWRYCRKCEAMFFDGYPSKGICPAGGSHVATGYNFILQHDNPELGQTDWRYCRKCQSLFFDGYPTTGRCKVDGHVAAGYNFVLPHDVPESGQSDWRFCSKCQAMFFDGYPSKGTCPAGGPHVAAGYNFILPHDVPGSGQSDWRFCSKCQAMFFDGDARKGTCPVDGGSHLAAGYNFILPHDVPEQGQADWRHCRNCQMIFFNGFESKGVCPAAGHEAAGFNFVMPHDTPAPGQNNWRFCSKCNCMYFDGYPTKGECPAGGSHVGVGYNFVLDHK